MFALIVIINKRIELIEHTFTEKSVDECYNKMLDCLANEFNKLNIDFPQDLIDFDCEWFDRNYMSTSSFTYNLYNSEQSLWVKPWTLEDIYSDVLDKIVLININENNNNDDE